jgi:hypothetical protein
MQRQRSVRSARSCASAPTDASDVGETVEPLDDTVTSRTTLRLPDRLKTRGEQAASEDGLSVNSWLVRAIAAALEPKSRRVAKRETRAGGRLHRLGSLVRRHPTGHLARRDGIRHAHLEVSYAPL